ncbi:MAG: SCP2 sterol-binding domain-containing protein, partial [Acidimicrobiia bacterium]|nr:SCP2 sterol-binding domain-containing protein [Acidimicrobiia bacterium]
HLAEADAIVARLDVAYMRVWAQMVRVQMLQARRGPGDLDAAEQLLADARRAAGACDLNTALRGGLLAETAADGGTDAPTARRSRRELLRAAVARRGRRAMSRMTADLSDEQLVARFGSPARLRMVLEAMAHTFQPSLAFGFQGRVVFELVTPAPGPAGGASTFWTVDIRENKAVVLKGAAADPAATVRLGVADYIRLVSGQLTPVGALVQRKVTAEGDVILASRLTEMFGGVDVFAT